MVYCIVSNYKEDFVMEPKKLYKSKTNRVLTGVCGGIGEYLNVDANIVRLICVLMCTTGVGLILYIAAAFLLPEGE